MLGGFAGGKPVADTDDATWEQHARPQFDLGILRFCVPAIPIFGNPRPH